MRHSIPYYIREQLREDRSVYIPGLGMFSLDQTSAHFNSDKTILHPPKLALVFSEKQGDEIRLLEKISAVENLTIDKARKKLKKYTDTIFNNLINLNKVEIKGVGTLIKEPDDQIKFQDSLAQLTDQFNGLKSLSITPIKRIMSSSAENSSNNFNDSQNRSNEYNETTSSPSRPWWIPLLGGVLLALAYIFFLKNCNEGTVKHGGTDEDGIERPIEENDKVAETNEIDIAEIEKELEENEERVEVGQDSKEVVVEEEVVKPVEENETVQEEIDYTEIEEEVDLDQSKNDLIESIETTVEVVEETVDKKPGKDKTSRVDESIRSNGDQESAILNAISYDGETCIIIVGSFGKAKNVLRMVQKVESLGYQSYQSPYGSLTRVGLQFKCEASQLHIYISEVRKKIESQAWYLESPEK